MNVSGTMTKSLGEMMNALELSRSIVEPRAAGFQDGFRICASDGRFGIQQTEEFEKRHLAAATGS